MPHASTKVEAALEHRFGLRRKAGDDVGAEGDVGAQAPRLGAEADARRRRNGGASCA